MEPEIVSYKPIGYLESIFASKNGTPRQSGLSEFARASIRISKAVFTNPEHSLMNLTQFSHLWVLWVFHQNTESNTTYPPRERQSNQKLVASTPRSWRWRRQSWRSSSTSVSHTEGNQSGRVRFSSRQSHAEDGGSAVITADSTI